MANSFYSCEAYFVVLVETGKLHALYRGRLTSVRASLTDNMINKEEDLDHVPVFLQASSSYGHPRRR
jgi:hypothetical protein